MAVGSILLGVVRSGSSKASALAPGIQLFVSYRRDDTAGYAGRLYDDLAVAFGPERIFFDVSTIELGQDFGVAIKEAIDRSTAVLALIGPTWLATTAGGTRRLDDPNDFVRLEIAAAIEAGKLLIPVLLAGAGMPSEASLPAPIAPLRRRQSFAITHARWRADVDLLIDELVRLHRRPAAAPSAAADPTSIDPLIGRDEDLANVLEELNRSRLVTLTGPGGSGKTRLAEAAIVALREEGRQASFVDLSAVETTALVGVTITTALRLEGAPGRDPIDVILDAIGDDPIVFALDNVEQIDDVGTPVLQLLRGAAGLSILATSRVPLGARGEVEVAVQALGLPEERSVASVEASPAGSLFLARARALGRLRTFDEATAADIATLLHHLDGLPLAVELAAARTRAMAPGEILRRLEREGPASIERGDGDRHRSLRVILDWTLDLLSETDRRVLDAVSVCAGFDVDLAQAIVGDEGIDALTTIESLVALGLVASAGTVEGVTRFRLLETIRTMVLRRLAPEHRAELQGRHAAWFAERAIEWDQASIGGWDMDLVERLDANADNIRRALDHLDVAAPRDALLFESRLDAFFNTRGRVAEGMARIRQTMALSPEPSVELARAMSALWSIGILQVSGPNALREAADEMIHVGEVVGDTRAVIEGYGLLLMSNVDRPTAERVATALERVDGSTLDQRGRVQLTFAKVAAAGALHGLASDQVIAAQRVQLAESSAGRTTGWRASAACNLAQTYLARREYAEAVDLATEAINLYRALERRSDLGWALGVRAAAFAEFGLIREAIGDLAEAAAIAEALQLDGSISDALRHAVPVALAAGQALLAATLWGGVLELSDRGRYVPQALDHQLAEPWLARAITQAGSDAVDLAIQQGRSMDPLVQLRSLRGQLTDDA